MKNKSFIIGMAGLVLGSALLGGVAGHFLTKRPNDTKPANPDIVSEDKYNDFELPDELNYVTFSRLKLNDYIDVFGVNSGSSYYLNKKTKDFKFLCSEKIIDSVQISDDKFVCYTSNNLYLFNIDKFSFDVIVLDGVYSGFDDLTCLSNNSLFIRAFSNSAYYLFKFDTDTMKYEKYQINSNVASNDYIFEYGNKLLFMRRSDSASSYSAYSLNKETGDIQTITNLYFNSTKTPKFVQRENKLYMVAKVSNANKLIVYDFDTDSFDTTDASFTYIPDGFIVNANGIYALSMSTAYASYFVSFSDNSAVSLGKFSNYFTIDDKLYLSRVDDSASGSGSSYKTATLYTFDEESKSVEKVFDGGSVSSPDCFKLVEIAGHKYIQTKTGSGTPFYYTYEYSKDSEGVVSFNLKSMNSSLNANKSYKIDEGEYVFFDGNLNYYNCNTDTYKKLVGTSSLSVNEITRNGGFLTIRADDNYVYEFNIKTLSCARIGYYENI